jgi:hypothetical protein
MKMKNKLLLISLLAININASEYKISVDKSNYNDYVKIENYTGNEPSIINCDLPLVPNISGDTCVNPIEEAEWIYTNGDNCNGLRQSNFNSNLYFARSRSNVVSVSLPIPSGYHWVTKAEYISLFNESTVSSKNDQVRTYYYQCGGTGYHKSEENTTQYIFLFSGGGNSGMHSGNYEYHGVTHNAIIDDLHFSGYVLYKD